MVKYNSHSAVEAQLIIPMAGLSRRFFDAGYAVPKAFIEVSGVSILAHIVNNHEFFSEILVIATFEDIQKFSMDKMNCLSKSNIKLVGINSHTKGPSYSILMAKEHIKRDLRVLVHYCDVFANWDIKETLSDLNSSDAVFLSFKDFHPSRLNGTTYAYTKLCENQPLVVAEIREKKSFSHNFEKENASTGIYGFKSGETLVQAIQLQVTEGRQVNGEFYTSLALDALVNHGYQVSIRQVDVFHAWGTPVDLQDFIYYSNFFESLAQVDTELLPAIQHSAVILAAGKSSRLKIKGNKPKQLMQITPSLKLIDFARHLVSDITQVHLVTQQEVYPDNYWNLPTKNFKVLSHGTESQLESVLVGQNLVGSLEGPITFLASDNIAFFDPQFSVDSHLGECDLLVWTSASYPFAKNDPEKYSWVKINDDGRVESSIRKARPANFKEWRLVIGNFTFRNNVVLTRLIDYVADNFENYDFELMLDDLITIAIELNLEIQTIEVPFFITLGNRSEESIFNYYMGVG